MKIIKDSIRLTVFLLSLLFVGCAGAGGSQDGKVEGGINPVAERMGPPYYEIKEIYDGEKKTEGYLRSQAVNVGAYAKKVELKLNFDQPTAKIVVDSIYTNGPVQEVVGLEYNLSWKKTGATKWSLSNEGGEEIEMSLSVKDASTNVYEININKFESEPSIVGQKIELNYAHTILLEI